MLKDAISLPGLAVRWMFAVCGEDERDESGGGEESPEGVRRSITKNLPVRLLEERDRDLYDVYKQGIVGGPSIVIRRYQERGQTRINVPRYGDSARECGLILGVDANALYLWSMMQDMPVGEGVTRDESRNSGRQLWSEVPSVAARWLWAGWSG